VSCKVGFWLDGFYADWEVVDIKISRLEEAISWAKTVCEQDGVRTRVRRVEYFENVVMDDAKYGFEEDIDIVSEEVVWESDE
jgi:hypothetical protein